jgi:hypothetical protein
MANLPERARAIYALHAAAGPVLLADFRKYAQMLLVRRIHEISSDLFPEVGWAPDVEYDLWRAVLDGPERASRADIEELRQLSIEAGGWYVFAGESENPEFLPLAKWQERYDAFFKLNKGREGNAP